MVGDADKDGDNGELLTISSLLFEIAAPLLLHLKTKKLFNINWVTHWFCVLTEVRNQVQKLIRADLIYK